MSTDPTEIPRPTDDASAAGLQVLRRFHVALRRWPGHVALYALVEEPPAADGTPGRLQLRWDGCRPVSRIPAAYASPSLSQSDGLS